MKGKRARTVIDHVLKHGSITSEVLKRKYGYNHPPRAIRDVKENGIPMEKIRVKGSDGRSIAAYTFGDPSKMRAGQFAGRMVLSATLKKQLLKRDGSYCAIYREALPAAALQIDHRVPFEVSGDASGADPDHYMLLCNSANRAKSWSCENCENGSKLKDPAICSRCYWAHPDNYDHIAMSPVRRLDLMWTGEDTREYDSIKERARLAGQAMPPFVKEILRKLF